MVGFTVLRDYMLDYIQSATVGITAEQLVDIVVKKCKEDSFYATNFTRKGIREIIATLINNPHIEVKFGYFYWRD